LQHFDKVKTARIEAAYVSPTDLERYLRSRLDGHQRTDWIDKLPLGIVSRCSEMLGASILFGPNIKASELSDQMLHEAGGAGFKILQCGASALRDCLVALKEDHLGRDGYHTYGLGIFLYWLTASRAPKELRPIRRIVRKFIVDHYPLDPGRVVLGHIVHRPKLISLKEASRRLHIRQIRVRTLCDAAGIVVCENPASLRESDFQGLID
jgi:hypothetical protein